LAQGLYANVSHDGAAVGIVERDRTGTVSTPAGERPARDQDPFSYDADRPRQRFGTDLNPWLNGVIGNWSSGTGRVQWRDFVSRGQLSA
jgi:hypothetical protein